MEPNQTFNSDFILVGIFNNSPTHIFLFSLVLGIFTVAVIGNTAMVLLICLDNQLHSPMYVLLSQLSLMDLMLICTTVPKMAFNYLSGRKSISLAGCGAQIFLYVSLLGAECFLLAAMAYDRYVAICHPLRYSILMSQKICGLMAASSWILADGLMQAAATLSFPFCDAHEVDHFFCEAPILVRLACADTSVFENVMYICCVLMLLVPFSLILTSYGLILAAVLQMRSTEARKKAFSTCSSHLSVVGLFYGAAIFIYMRPKSYRTANQDKVVSAFYTVFTPVLNPLIYSLRNSEVKGALKKWLRKYASIKSYAHHV
uniref:Olfactory receptor n=1 Tax=Suricata suricatta TaxID=37032 RepID=A0A673SM06_SURSU